MVRDGHEVCTGYGPGQYGHVRATSATASPCLADSATGLEMAAAVTCADVSTIEMMADRHVFRAAFACQHHGRAVRADAQLSFLHSNMTCYQTLKSARTLSPPVTTWVRLARAVRARSSSDRLGLHAYGHGAYWEADGGVMPARLSTRTAVDGSDGDGVCSHTLLTTTSV